jgi:hypothetical protein
VVGIRTPWGREEQDSWRRDLAMPLEREKEDSLVEGQSQLLGGGGGAEFVRGGRSRTPGGGEENMIP